jgi:hypothetical protein
VFVNGARSIDNNFQMDGVQVNNFGTGRGGDWLGYSGIPIPNPDAIQEFNVQTSLYDAGYGRGAGANVNVVTKSGGNQFHGNLFEFFRNDALDANDFFLNETSQPRSVLRQNQFGGTLGGPVVKDKLFFFTSYQGTRQTNGVGSSSSSSALLPAQLTDSRTAAALGQAFCGQTGYEAIACDGSNINPVALKLLNYQLANGQYLIPAPQIIQSGGYGYSAFSIPSKFTEDQYLGNCDYFLSPKNTLSARVFISDDPQIASFTTNYLELPGSGAETDFRNRSIILKLTSALTPRLVNEAHFSFNRNYGRMTSLMPVTDADIGMVQPADLATIPVISINGLFNLGGTFNDDFTTAINSFQGGDQLSTTIGRHNLRFGTELERVQDNFNLPGVKRGTIDFLSFADFLLGESAAQNGTEDSNLYSSSAQAGITDRHFRVNNLSSFVQDDFKVNSQLTLNLGLRWEVFGGLSEKAGRLVNFWLTGSFPKGWCARETTRPRRMPFPGGMWRRASALPGARSPAAAGLWSAPDTASTTRELPATTCCSCCWSRPMSTVSITMIPATPRRPSRTLGVRVCPRRRSFPFGSREPPMAEPASRISRRTGGRRSRNSGT